MAKRAYIGVETPQASTGSLEVGSSVFLNVGGVRTEFLVVHQGNPDETLYDSSCDGTWLLMKDAYERRVWDSTDNDYENSDIHSYLNGDFLGLFDADIQSVVKEVKIPYHKGTSKNGSISSVENGLQTRIFLLSGYELGWTTSNSKYLPEDGSCLKYFSGTSAEDVKRIAYQSGSKATWSLRSLYSGYDDEGHVFAVGSTGQYSTIWTTSNFSIRPALILPSKLAVETDGSVTSEEAVSKGIARKVKKGYVGIDTLQSNTGSLEVGSSVFLNVGGTKTEFLVVHQGNPDTSMYDESCDGTWLLMKDIYENRAWNSSSSNSFASSSIYSHMKYSFFSLFDADVQAVIKEVKIPFRNSAGSIQSGSSGLSTKIFLLSGYEVGFTSSYSYLPKDGARLDYFADNGRIAYYNGTATQWWLRSGSSSDETDIWTVKTDGTGVRSMYNNFYGIRPAIVLPSNLSVESDGTISTAVLEEPFFKSIARKIKKAYIGIGNIARPCWSGGELAYYGTATAFSVGRYDLSATTVGDYALFGGGIGSSVVTTVDAYDTSLTRTKPTEFGSGRARLAATTVGDYALFGGGANVNYDPQSSVYAYNKSLTRTTPTALSVARKNLASASVGDYALFAGGTTSASADDASSVVDVYDKSLTRTTATKLSVARTELAATTVGNYALFGGGYNSTLYQSVVEAYDDNLTKTIQNELSVGRRLFAATHVGNYALFGGGYASGNVASTAVDAYTIV